jgi:mono/diheme cytochrome c family protein
MPYRRLLPLLAAVALSCAHQQVPLPAIAETQLSDASVARGEYIVRNAAVCGHCHAADRKNPDGPLSGGAEFRNWRVGVARASNLTPDPTGLGDWSEAEIVRALRNGVSRDGRLLIPVMPYEWLHEMSDGDAVAVARYLKSLPPVRNEVRQSPNFWFKLGKVFFLRPLPGTTVSAPPRAATAAYGAYLSQHVSLCADCHTPRVGIRSAPDRTRLFAGDATPPEGFPANPSNLTPDNETGIGRWSEADFIKTLRSGVTPEGEKLHPFMPREVGRMTDDDLRAIYLYLRALPAIRNEVSARGAS